MYGVAAPRPWPDLCLQRPRQSPAAPPASDPPPEPTAAGGWSSAQQTLHGHKHSEWILPKQPLGVKIPRGPTRTETGRLQVLCTSCPIYVMITVLPKQNKHVSESLIYDGCVGSWRVQEQQPDILVLLRLGLFLKSWH